MGGGIGPAGVGGAAVALAFAVMVPMRWVGRSIYGHWELDFKTRLGMYFYFPDEPGNHTLFLAVHLLIA